MSVAPSPVLFPGKIIEISGLGGTPRLSLAAAWVAAAQRAGETTAWVQSACTTFYPPDVAASGVDLAALVVIHVPAQAGWLGLPKAAQVLLRSGGYGLVVLDLCPHSPAMAAAKTATHTAWQGRLLQLVRLHRSCLVILTDKPAHADSLGPFVALRLEPQRRRVAPGLFTMEMALLKNKSGLAPNLITPPPMPWRGPVGLR